MARPREFDEDVVLERAARAFWEHGYEATSVADLEQATGLAKGSLYKAFENKHVLFLRALDRYLSEGQQTLAERLVAASSGAQGIADWLRTVGRMATEGPIRRGCFAVNSTVERAPTDAEVRARLRRHEREVEKLYAAAIRRGINEGAFRDNLEPTEAARYLSGVIHGMQVLGKASLDAGEVESIVQLTLRALS